MASLALPQILRVCFLLPGPSYFNERSSLDSLNLAFLWFAQPWFRGHGDASLFASMPINTGSVAEKSEMTIPESPEVRCLSRFRYCQTENSGIVGSAMLFLIPESSNPRILNWPWA